MHRILVTGAAEFIRLDLHRFRGLFKTEDSARKGEHCHEQTRLTPRSFAEKLSGWLELPMRSILSPGSLVRSVSPMAPFGAGSTRTRSTAVSEKGSQQRRWQDALLIEKIREIHSRSRETYGYHRVHAELRSLGVRCGRRRVARLMRAAGLRGCMRGKKRRTTRRDPRAAPAPDLLCRDFVAGRPNRVWLADITYIPTREGFLYLAFILDTHSRKVVGWSMAPHMRTELVVDALEMAVWRRKPVAGLLVHHSDRGVQYTAISFGKRLEEVGIVASMGRTGTALDNAMAKSFVATLKTELLMHRRRFP